MKKVDKMIEVVVVLQREVEKVAEETWLLPLSNCLILDGKNPISATQK
jgi:hypothetical protein